MDPRLSVRVVHGDLEGELSVPERWTVSARGDLSATPPAFDVGVDVRDLAALLLFTPAAMPAGDGGALAAHGQVRLAAGEGTKPSAEFVVTEARLDARDRPGLVHSASDVRVSLANDRIVLGDVHAVGEGVDLRLHGSLDLAAEKPDGRREGDRNAPTRRCSPSRCPTSA